MTGVTVAGDCRRPNSRSEEARRGGRCTGDQGRKGNGKGAHSHLSGCGSGEAQREGPTSGRGGRGRLPEGTAPSPGSGPQERICVCWAGRGGQGGGWLRGVDGAGDGASGKLWGRNRPMNSTETVGGETRLAQVTMTCLACNPVV